MHTEMIDQSISHAAVNTIAYCIKTSLPCTTKTEWSHPKNYVSRLFFFCCWFGPVVHQHISAQSLDLLSFSHKKTGGHHGSSVCPRWPHRDDDDVDDVIHGRFSLSLSVL